MTPPEARRKLSRPFIRSEKTIAQIRWRLSLALTPALLASIYVFGFGMLAACACAVLSALAAELLAGYLLNIKFSFENGHSFFIALVSAVLLTPFSSFGAISVAVFLSLFFGKYIFGGEGGYLFNPAAAGLLLAGMFAGSSPLFHPQTDGLKLIVFYAAATVSGFSVLGQKNIRWQIPFFYLVTLFLALALIRPSFISGLIPAYLFLFALFVLPEFGTAPVTKKGAQYFGIGAGILTFLGFDAAHFLTNAAAAALIANSLTPWIDDWVRPRGSRIRWEAAKSKP